MNLGTLKTTALATLVVAAFSAPSARAALTYTTDDLFLAFRQAGNNTTDYVVNIGQASIYRDATSSIPLNLTGLSADLTTAFGSLTGLSWGVVGTTQNDNSRPAPDNLIRLIYTSEPIGSSPTASNAQSGPSNNINTFKNFWLTGTEGTVVNSAFESASDANSWNTRVAASFGSPAVLNTIEDSLTNNIDLFRVPQTSSGQVVTNEGYFSFNAGAVTFVPLVPAPEPSTAFFGCAMVGAICLLRRRTVLA
jgi:hypothetical protein